MPVDQMSLKEHEMDMKITIAGNIIGILATIKRLQNAIIKLSKEDIEIMR